MIKIKNIYHMLAYAFQVLSEERNSYAIIASEDFEYAEDLLAAILAKGIANQIKKGLGREYILQTDLLNKPRGKIDISTSIKTQSLLRKQVVCQFDVFSENAYVNQILKSVATMLIRSDKVAENQKKSLKKVLLYFSDVDLIKPCDIRWSNIKYNRNNETYRMLINICYLAVEALLPSTEDGTKKISKFKDEQLHRLFEKFVLEYYRKHYSDIKVSAAQIEWNVDDNYIDLLPTMKSDITLEFDDNVLIIDTKYYSRTLQTNSLYNSQTIHSSNIYQIFTYVKNKDSTRSGNVSGLLLYAKTDEKMAPDNSYLMDGNRISVKTLDLDKEFNRIREQLDKIIKEWLQIV